MFAWVMTWLALRRAGAKAVRITSETDTEDFRLDGLVIGGGSDIDLENYGEELLQLKEPELKHSLKDRLLGIVLFLFRVIFSIKMSYPKTDAKRDALEKKLCLDALYKNLPVLGICRGAQLINTSLGGTLHQDTQFLYGNTTYQKYPAEKTCLSEKQQ
ncbi:MAG: gamma-glutamyl-gamma-aminobutyrate hydrolase family protein [Desulfobacterales bacterium]